MLKYKVVDIYNGYNFVVWNNLWKCKGQKIFIFKIVFLPNIGYLVILCINILNFITSQVEIYIIYNFVL